MVDKQPLFCNMCTKNGVQTEVVFNPSITHINSKGEKKQTPLDAKTKQKHECKFMRKAKPKVNAKINQITPLVKSVNLEAVVIGLEEQRSFNRKDGSTGIMQKALLGDDTGEITLTLWDGDVGKVKVADHIKLDNVFVTVYQEKVQLSVGKFGKLTVYRDGVGEIKAEQPSNSSEEEDIPTL